MSNLTLKELEMALAKQMAMIKITEDKIAKKKGENWDDRKRLWWMLWLEENDNDAFQHLMATIHKTLLFKDVKFNRGHHVTGFNNGHQGTIDQRAIYNDTQVHSGAKALQIAKWGLNSKREGGLDEYSYSRANNNRRFTRRAKTNYQPDLTSIIAEGDYWGTEESVLRDCWVHTFFKRRDGVSGYGNAEDYYNPKCSKIAVAGLFNPCVAPDKHIKAICVLKSKESKTPIFNAQAYGISNNGVDRGGDEEQNFDNMMGMLDHLGEEGRNKIINPEHFKASAEDYWRGEEDTEPDDHDYLNAIDDPNNLHTHGLCETVNWTRWMDNWRYTGVNLNGINFNPVAQHCDTRETLRDPNRGNQRILPFADNKSYQHSEWGWDRSICMGLTKPQLLTIAERQGIYAPKSWSKHKIYEGIIRGNRYGRTGYVPYGFKAIA
jgi:hypothetical protein